MTRRVVLLLLLVLAALGSQVAHAQAGFGGLVPGQRVYDEAGSLTGDAVVASVIMGRRYTASFVSR